MFPNGNYKLKYNNKPNAERYTIRIEDEKYIEYHEKGLMADGKIHWIYNCMFQFNTGEKMLPDPGTIQRKLLDSFGEQCFELQRRNNDTVFFRTTYTGNVHITIAEGWFIRIK
jgi:hypothetical protein